MHTSIIVLALWGTVGPHVGRLAIPWQPDYRTARSVAARDHKPIAIFVGRGADGWRHLIRDGAIGEEARRALTLAYVPVYLDQDTDAGQAMAEAFHLNGRGGLVISDRTGGVMALRHEGKLTGYQLTGHLTRFADPSLIVSTTEGAVRPAAQPIYYGPPVTSYYSPYQNPAICPT